MTTRTLAATTPRRATRHQDAVSVGAATWLIVGLFSDGWAHHNVPGLESFFTPWHAALYSGFVATALWFVWLGREGGRRWYRALPHGYESGAAGIAVFGVGGLTDMAWHLTFGVESGLDALLSPTHLLLFSGGALILSSPIRSRWSARDTTSVIAMTALTLLTALVAFFLLYVNEFATTGPLVGFEALPESDPGHTTAQLPAVAGLASFLVTTALVVTPQVLVWQRGHHPRGQLVLLVGVVAGLSAAVVDLEPAPVAGAAGAVVGALVGELAVARLDLGAGPARIPALAAAAIAPVWIGHLVGLGAAAQVAWSIELVSGVVVLSTLAAGALGVVASGPSARRQAVDPA